jgi:EGF-like domain
MLPDCGTPRYRFIVLYMFVTESVVCYASTVMKIAQLMISALTDSDRRFAPIDIERIWLKLCDRDTCLNKGTCLLALSDGLGYVCKCPAGVSGLNCEIGKTLAQVSAHCLIECLID